MSIHFEFATASRIIFGNGAFKQVGALVKELGCKALVVRGHSESWIAPLPELLSEAGIGFSSFSVPGEPTVDFVQQGVELARRERSEVVIGIGGGSAIDTAKAIAILATNPGEITDYLEVIGRGNSFSLPPLPVLAIPTTAGTGAEVTRNAVIGAPEHHVKVSLRSPMMLPKIALVDPELTLSLPPEVTASTGMDALTQLIEPFVSNKANPLTDALCRDGIARAATFLERAFQNGSDMQARENMSLASLFGGLALANAKLGAVHGFAGVLGGMIAAPHGAVCACILPFALETNLRALQSRQPGHAAIERFTEIARLLTGDTAATAQDGVEWVKGLGQRLGILPLHAFGLQEREFPDVINNTARSSSMQGNPVQLTFEEMGEILAKAFINQNE